MAKIVSEEVNQHHIETHSTQLQVMRSKNSDLKKNAYFNFATYNVTTYYLPQGGDG